MKYLAVFDVGNRNTVKFAGIFSCILTGFVRINRMDTLKQTVCGLHLFFAASCPSEETFKKKII